MNIGLHDVKRVMVDKGHQLSTSTYTCVIRLVTVDGRVDITLFADSADKLAIKQVKDINDFYETELPVERAKEKYAEQE